MIRGVKIPSTRVILLKSIKEMTMISREQSKAPAQLGSPNCCCKLAPAPATMTKPTTKQEMINVTSMMRLMTGWAICSSTS